MTELEQLYGLEMGWGWREERGPGRETRHSAADQPWDLPAVFFSLSLSCLHRKEFTGGVLHLWLNQSESPGAGRE